MTNLLVDSRLSQYLDRFAIKPSHAVLFSGKPGVGLKTIALNWAKRIAGQHQVIELGPDDKGTITIAAIRELYTLTRSRTDNLVVLLDEADAMGAPAQNALLKLLEEPNKNVHFVLTSHMEDKLLPTVLSRLQIIRVPALKLKQTTAMLETANLEASLARKLNFLGGGLPAEMTRLINNPIYREERLLAAETAKRFLVGKRPEQLQIVEELTANRAQAEQFIGLLIKMVELQLQAEDPTELLEYLDRLLSIQDKLANNGHVRTQLLLAVK